MFQFCDWKWLIICFFIEHVQDKNPKNAGRTPLYFAAEHGHLSICQLIIEKIEDKNPKGSTFGWTPLHCAALNGHFAICKLIMDNVEDKNPTGDFSDKKFYASTWKPTLAILKSFNFHFRINSMHNVSYQFQISNQIVWIIDSIVFGWLVWSHD